MGEIIQNLFIIKNGLLLTGISFGECHSFKSESELVSGFLTAIQIMSLEITGDSMKSVLFENFSLYFHRDLTDIRILYVIIADPEEDPENIDTKIHLISEVFIEKYQDDVEDFRGDTTPFKTFGDNVKELGVIQKNCGEFPDCRGCLNNTRVSEVLSLFRHRKKIILPGN